MMKKIVMSIVALATINTVAFGDCTSRSCANVDISKLYMTNYGGILVDTSGTEANLNCTAPVGHYMTIRREDAGSKSLYSMLLTAQTTKKKINIAIEEGSADCHILAISVAS